LKQYRNSRRAVLSSLTLVAEKLVGGFLDLPDEFLDADGRGFARGGLFDGKCGQVVSFRLEVVFHNSPRRKKGSHETRDTGREKEANLSRVPCLVSRDCLF